MEDYYTRYPGISNARKKSKRARRQRKEAATKEEDNMINKK